MKEYVRFSIIPSISGFVKKLGMLFLFKIDCLASYLEFCSFCKTGMMDIVQNASLKITVITWKMNV